MLRQEPRFSFRNLEPISYLKTFNKMVEYNGKHPLKVSPRHELKTVSLTKFPLPHFYQDMEGIFESVGRKKLDPNNQKRHSSQSEQQDFMKKHNEFMRKVLTRFIDHNESRQSLYEKEKKYIRKHDQMSKHIRTLSEPKLKNVKTTKQPDVNPEGGPSQIAKATKGSSIKLDQDLPIEQPHSVLPTLKPRRKKQKFTVRGENKVEEYILSQKLATPTSVSTARKAHLPQEDQVDFREEIINIQLKQVHKQESFAEKIEKQIAQFEKKMDIQVHAIKYYNFWREKKEGDETVKSHKEEGLSERADLSIRFGNYTTR